MPTYRTEDGEVPYIDATGALLMEGDVVRRVTDQPHHEWQILGRVIVFYLDMSGNLKPSALVGCLGGPDGPDLACSVALDQLVKMGS